MKIFTNTKFKRRIALILLILTIFSFLIPVKSEAFTTFNKAIKKLMGKIGDLVLKGVNKLIFGISDGLLKTAQHYVMGTDYFTSKIELTPEVIFKNDVPLTNASFSAWSKTPESLNKIKEYENFTTKQLWLEVVNDVKEEMRQHGDLFTGNDDNESDENNQDNDNADEATEEIKIEDFNIVTDDVNDDHYGLTQKQIDKIEKLENFAKEDDYRFMLLGNLAETNLKANVIASIAGSTVDNSDLVRQVELIYAKTDDGRNPNYYKKTDFSTEEWEWMFKDFSRYILKKVNGKTNVNELSIGDVLGKTISKWYIILRNLSLIIMLSVLVYIGIRIVLSSVAQEKSKYKNMLMDWLIGICLLFSLQLIMAFISGTIDNITDAIGSMGQSSNLIKTIRSEAYSGNQIGLTIVYFAMVIMTLMYLFYYVKRALNIAFLTLIAPLVAMTYPIDKLADGKAQAFNMWFREYLFNCLIQPVHLLLYMIFVTSAIDFAKENILYALVVLWFMRSAESIVKKFFGFDSKAPGVGGPGTLAAAGMTYRAMSDFANGVKKKSGGRENSGNSDSSSNEKNNNIRTKKDDDTYGGFEKNSNQNSSEQGQDSINRESSDNENGQGQNFGEGGNSDTGSEGGQDFNDGGNSDAGSEGGQDFNDGGNSDAGSEGGQDFSEGGNSDTGSEGGQDFNDGGNSDAGSEGGQDFNDGGNSDAGSEGGQDFSEGGNSDTGSEGRQDFSEGGESDTEGEQGQNIDENITSNNVGKKDKRKITKYRVYKGGRFALRTAGKLARTYVKAVGATTGAAVGLTHAVMSGKSAEEIIRATTNSAIVGKGLADGAVNIASKPTSYVGSKISNSFNKDKQLQLDRQYAEFKKKNKEKFKDAYGKDYKEQMAKARDYVDAGYTNFDDIKQGFKIEKRNNFTSQQARTVMKMSKSDSGKNILNEKSTRFKEKLHEKYSEKDAKRVINALEDIQMGFIGDGPAEKNKK